MMVSTEKRVLGLDLVRALAILLVLFNHSVSIMDPIVQTPVIGNILGKLLALFQPLGMLGVELFFVLSGYLIGNILLKQYLNAELFSLSDVISFWKRRWYRTIPVYFLVLSILFVIGGVFYWKYYLFIQCFDSNRIYFFPESWSLPVEEWFYLVLPIFLLVIARVFKKYSKQNIFLITIFSFIIVFVIIRCTVIALSKDSYNVHTQIRTMTFLRLDAIGFGVLMAYFTHLHKSWVIGHAKKLLTISITLTIVLIGIYYLGTHPLFLWYDQVVWYKWLIDRFFYLILPMSLCLCLPQATTIKSTQVKWLDQFLTHTSKISYSIYLLHSTLIHGFIFKRIQVDSGPESVLVFMLYLICCYVSASLLYKYFEIPTTRLRELKL